MELDVLDSRQQAMLNFICSTCMDSAKSTPIPETTSSTSFLGRYQWNENIHKFEEFQNAVEGY
jgi:hypothetical protein